MLACKTRKSIQFMESGIVAAVQSQLCRTPWTATRRAVYLNTKGYFMKPPCRKDNQKYMLTGKCSPLWYTQRCITQTLFQEKLTSQLRRVLSADSFHLAALSGSALALRPGQSHSRSCPCWSSLHPMIMQGSI